jgi:hypothetical protein
MLFAAAPHTPNSLSTATYISIYLDLYTNQPWRIHSSSSRRDPCQTAIVLSPSLCITTSDLSTRIMHKSCDHASHVPSPLALVGFARSTSNDIENSFEIIVKAVYRCCLRASLEIIAFKYTVLTEWLVQTGKSKDDRRCTLSTDELSTPAGQR